MATYNSFLTVDDRDTNVFDADFLSTLLYYAPAGAYLSMDNKSMVYDFGGGGVAFTTDGTFDGAWNGTVNAVVSGEGETIYTIGAGYSIDGLALRDAIAEGDTETINLLAWSGNDIITGGDSRDTLRGYGGRDVISGMAGNDTLIGDGGNDTLYGNAGSDNLTGGAGNDGLSGGAGEDVLIGGAGNDVLVGGGGSDSLSGGTGADRFDFRSFLQLRGDDYDWITDFSQAQGDKIDLHRIDADTGTAGDQAFTFIDNTGGTLSSPPAAGSLVLQFGIEDNTYAVTLVIDNAGTSETFFVHAAEGALTADDFIL